MGKNQSTSKDVVKDDIDSLPSQQEKIVRRPRAKDKVPVYYGLRQCYNYMSRLLAVRGPFVMHSVTFASLPLLVG